MAGYRTCLWCDREFWSHGPENRKCGPCQQGKADNVEETYKTVRLPVVIVRDDDEAEAA